MVSSSRDAVDDLVDAVRRGGGDETVLGAKSLAYRLRRVAHQLEVAMRRELAAHGIELWELEMLAALKRAPEHRLTAGQVMELVELTSGSVTHRITRLEARGWVRRDKDPADRRSVLVSLTPEGEQQALASFALKTEIERGITAVLDPETIDLVNDALRQVSHHLKGRDDE
ncbi:MarR family winged helix-turn-helix transcriptional regulator [Amycolatopsis benzoatilytica]|uniref:MarR family winged helix-turn-helix transcriptional regulator n=1 Tax=Amycolatopsis benzoatilytica TaxID=346045 RepID=UPI00036CC9C0|nr:MarR family transcriptional regulator [Amycolatopsis benzoatilytica]